MDRRRTLTMNWNHVEDDDDGFFEPRDRFSSAAPEDMELSGSGSEDDYEDSRMSFSTAVSASAPRPSLTLNTVVSRREIMEAAATAASARPRSASDDYDMWMAEPGDVKERRRRLLQGMGLLSNKSLHKIASAKKFARVITRKAEVKTKPPVLSPKTELPPPPSPQQDPTPPEPHFPSPPVSLVRSRSAGDIGSLSQDSKNRKEELIGPISKQNLTRTLSGLPTLNPEIRSTKPPILKTPPRNNNNNNNNKTRNRSTASSVTLSDGGVDVDPVFLTNNVNDEFNVKENDDSHTGKEQTDEFERPVGFSPVVKEVMRRSNDSTDDRKQHVNYLSRSVRYSKRRGVAILKNLKNIKGVAHKIAEKDRDMNLPGEQKQNKNSSQWIKVRQHGKPYKEFTGLHLCQEIHAHEGSIWSVKFSPDAHYLATAGEDKVIHIWEVQECDVMAGRAYDDLCSVGGTPFHPMASPPSPGSPRHPMAASPVSESPLGEEKRKKGRAFSRKKGNSAPPDYVIVPETVFALSEKPVCSLVGHQDVVLDLSWSRSQLLLSSSMDKTVRLWDVETQNCLKMFAHNDYVTCIQFNPVDEDSFISGSLDSKIRIWNITDRKVVDWNDQKEMVTATCYTPDGKGAMIGSHRGSCRYYNTTDYKLEQQDQFETQNKKKLEKSQFRKITGFQYSPWNHSELLISTADSRIRIHDGSGFTHKFKGFRNTSSQISASFSPDGKYVISASEDSEVYVWKKEEPKNAGAKGRRVIIHSYEHFPCKDVSVAIPWPGSITNEPPVVELHTKRHSKRFLPPQHPTIGSPSKATGSPTARRFLPPLPRRKDTTMVEGDHESEIDNNQHSQTDPGTEGDNDHHHHSASPSMGNSPSRSWSALLDGVINHGGSTIQATAWGFVIVTASLGGEIRVYQNFGLPLKVSRLT